MQLSKSCAILAIALSTGAIAGNKGNRLNGGGVLFGDAPDFLQSVDGRYHLIMQADCNLVLYKGNHVFWASGTQGRGRHCRAVMQGDGNFVVYTGNAPLWSSNTQGRPTAFVTMQDDGNAVVYQGGRPFWASNTRVPEPNSTPVSGHPNLLRAGQALDGARNDFLQAPGTAITFRMQPDCNLVLYEGNVARWASNT